MTLRSLLLIHWLACRSSFVTRVLAVSIIFSDIALGQSIVVQLVNGHDGKPLARVRVYVGFDDLKGRQPLDLTTDALGEVQFEAKGAQTIQVHPVGEVTCGEQPTRAPYSNYSIEEILKEGLLTKNNCGHLNAEPLRGKLLYFVRPAKWWELFKN